MTRRKNEDINDYRKRCREYHKIHNKLPHRREADRKRGETEHRKKQMRRFSTSKIQFFGRSIYLGWNPKKNICSNCKRSVESGEIKLTSMHHLEYCIIFPWFGTIELCMTCHYSEHRDKHKHRNRRSRNLNRSHKSS
jgi:hypothetical protein